MLRSGATSYYHADGLGSITSLSSSAGAIANTYTYDSFGNLTASTGSLVNSFQYTGREFDSETGLYYYRARYLDQSVGRFISEDPIRFWAGANFYSYVHNQVPNLSDPSGLDSGCPSWVPSWLCKWWKSPKAPPKPKPAPAQPMPVNICEKGQTALFWEAGPNPYYHGNAGEGDWNNFTSAFSDKCFAAKKPGKYTVLFCTAGTGVLGAFAYCMCCEGDTCGK